MFIPPAFFIPDPSDAAEKASAAGAAASAGDVWSAFVIIAFIATVTGIACIAKYSEEIAMTVFAALLIAILIALLGTVAAAGYGFFYDLALFDELSLPAAGILALLWGIGILCIWNLTDEKTGLKAFAAHFGAFAVVFFFALALFVGQQYFGLTLEQMRGFGFPVLVLVPILFFYTVNLIGSSSPRGKDRNPKLQDKPEEGAGNTNNIDIQ